MLASTLAVTNPCAISMFSQMRTRSGFMTVIGRKRAFGEKREEEDRGGNEGRRRQEKGSGRKSGMERDGESVTMVHE